MDYKKIYHSLINFRKLNYPNSKYVEKHHILPKSMGGKNSKKNIVTLTAREHYIAHLLLARFNKCRQTICALHNMQRRPSKYSDRSIIKTSRLYNWVREQHAAYMSEYMSAYNRGYKNSQFNSMWICNRSLKENRKIKKDSVIPSGWEAGRNNWNKKYTTTTKLGSKEHKERLRAAKSNINYTHSIETRKKNI